MTKYYAHLVGTALPFSAGRFEAARSPRDSDAHYRQKRARYLGQGALQSALDAAARLERQGPLADRYFPELALAWRALEALGQGQVPAEWFTYDCIAVDECQDLTATEASLLIELAAQSGRRRRSNVPLLLAGDEAQTVRPTDFEWRWLNDLLHHRLGSSSEFKLSANLRSPRQIATLVNRVWDLYDELDKKDRPSGSGYAEIDDDSSDQVLYCAATPGAELNDLLTSLAAREGLALVSFEEQLPGWLPSALRDQVLTAREIKGLDFDSVCILDAGKQIEKISRYEQHSRAGGAEVESIRKRLAIDQLRVALSRPTGRLIWLDINPSSWVSQASGSFLNDYTNRRLIQPAMPSAIQKSLEEEELDVEERIQRALADARQYLELRPGLAWSRATQAAGLLGKLGQPGYVEDEALRKQVQQGVCEVAATLALRGAKLPAEFGQVDLWSVARAAAVDAEASPLPLVLHALADIFRPNSASHIVDLMNFAGALGRWPQALQPWLRTELGGQLAKWTAELDEAALRPEHAQHLIAILPAFYDALHLPDAEARKTGLAHRMTASLLKQKRYAEAYHVLQQLPTPDPGAEAECLVALERYAEAAAKFRDAGNMKSALDCYRRVPDFDNAAALIGQLGTHTAAGSYEWLQRLRQVVQERPENFNRVMLEPEKKVLEQMLEQALGVARKKPGAKKAAAKKSPAKKAAKKAARRPYF